MTLKLALRNIARNLRDYAIYFVTLLFGVAVFFAFNSISSQQVLFDVLERATSDIFELTDYMMRLFSIVVAFVLGFLVIYANRFLVRRRKHEFGIYLTLGMSPGRVTRIVLLETAIIGVGALVGGLAIGVGLAQGLSFVTAALFGTTLTHYEFVFSADSLWLTLVCFVVIFVIVAMFNSLVVSRLKLIDLLYASRKNERTPVRNPVLCALGFVVAVALLIGAYRTLQENGMEYLDSQFVIATVLMLVGTLLFFWSLAGVVLGIVTRLRTVYLKGLRPFTLRQISSKINTAFLSLWAVCVMLFFSITVFSTGMGLVEVFTGDIEATNPYDVSLRTDHPYIGEEYPSRTGVALNTRSRDMEERYPGLYAEAASYDFSPLAYIEERVPTFNEMVKSAAEVQVWELSNEPYTQLEAVLDHAGKPLGEEDAALFTQINCGLTVISLSDFNALRSMMGNSALALEPGRYAVINNASMTDPVAQKLVDSQAPVDFAGTTLTAQRPMLTDQLSDNVMPSSMLYFVVPDEVVDHLKDEGAIPFSTYVNIQLRNATPEGEDAFLRTLYEDLKPEAFPSYEDSIGTGHTFEDGTGYYDGTLEGLWPISSTILGSEMKAQSGGLRMLITYLALYIGFVLLIATAAILAIQQLSEAADAQGRYLLLANLGCDAHMLSRSLLAQVLIYFLAPLGLAVVHSAVAISVLSGTLFEGFAVNAATPIALAALLVVIVYGSYLAITYALSRNLVLRPQASRT